MNADTALAFAPVGFAVAAQRGQPAPWAVDLGYRIGSAEWWRGFATLGAMLSCALLAMQAIESPTPPSRFPDAMSASQRELLAPLTIGPLADGGRTGARVPMTPQVRALAAPLEPASVSASTRMRRGESLASALARAGASRSIAKDAQKALEAQLGTLGFEGGAALHVTLGRRLSADEPRPLDALSFRAAFDKVVEARRLGGQLLAKAIPLQVVDAPARIEGSVGSSLYVAARRAGVPAGLVNQYVKLLSFGVDFQRDVVASDRFSLAFERKIAETGEVRTGKLLYAALMLKKSGKTLELTGFSPSGGALEYFHADGVSVKRMLMKTPIEGGFRQTSGFGMRRHPILGYSRMHKGIDFAAPTGTPVLASGAGTVASAAFNSGYGNVIVLSHGQGFQTRYAHLRGFARGVRTGARVEQGQVIGYVGTTGLSTGPHLHYEVYLKGAAVNPADSKLPTGRWLAGRDLANFKAQLAAMRAISPNVSPAEVLAEHDIKPSSRS